MSSAMFFNGVVSLAMGLTLLLAWRHDRQQPFAYWFGCAFLVSVIWIPAYGLYFHAPPPWPWLGVILWAVQSSLGLVFLAVGANLLHGVRRRRRTFAALLLLLLAAHVGVASQSVVFAIGLRTVAFVLVSAYVASLMWRGFAAEKLAAAMVMLGALLGFIIPLAGMENAEPQFALVGATRLVMGLALIYASLSRSNASARLLSSQYSQLTESAHQGVLVLQEGAVVYANPALLHMFALESRQQIAPDWAQWGLSEGDRRLNERRRQQLASGAAKSLTWEQEWQHRDGTPLRLRLSAWLIEWEGRPAEQVVVSDETQQYASAQLLLHQATHDKLTGLANRLLIEQRFLEAAVDEDASRRIELLLINIDNFAAVNDSLGYAAGDEFLKLIAARIDTALTPADTLARLSGDEFLVMRSSAQAQGDVVQLADQILASMRHPFHLHGMSVKSSASIGVAICPHDGRHFETLLGHANIAARRAKEAGRNIVRFFNEAMNAHALEDMQLNTELHGAIAQGQLELALQPVLDARTSRIVGAEALLRWRHPTRGMVPPSRFIPVAERSGLIVDVGTWVIHEACRILNRWQPLGALSELTLSINVSATQFSRGDIDTVLATALRYCGAPRSRLELEVTESALINDPEQFVRTLAQVRRMGLKLAIDDFGTGYSNLAYLQRFQVDKLKIDQSFVQRLRVSQQDQAIVQAVIQMARSLGLKTTAEGIEDAETHHALVALGCDLVQGYLYGRPMPLGEFETFASSAVEPGV